MFWFFAVNDRVDFLQVFANRDPCASIGYFSWLYNPNVSWFFLQIAGICFDFPLSVFEVVDKFCVLFIVDPLPL
jgi:hypothetical protein